MTNKLTDDALNLAVAESIEPNPEWEIQRFSPFHPNILSKGKCWIRDGGLFPSNFIHNPIMRDMLQQKLLDDGWGIRIVGKRKFLDSSEKRFMELTRGEDVYIVRNTRERVWPEAWLATRRKR